MDGIALSKIVRFRMQTSGALKITVEETSTRRSTSTTALVVSRPSRRVFSDPPELSPYSPTFVHILVGPNQKDFAIHRNLICQLSGFFDAAFNGSFSEASSGIIELYEEDPDLFELVYKWCYMKDTARYNDGQSIMCGAEQIVRLWVLGDRYDMPGLCNEAANQVIRDYEDNNYVFTNVTQIYQTTLPGSALRRVVIASYMNNPHEGASLYEEQEKTFLECPEFLLDLTKALSERLGGVLSWKFPSHRQILNQCQYHHHATDEKCIRVSEEAST